MGNTGSGSNSTQQKDKKDKGGGFFFWRKKKQVLPEPKEPIRGIQRILANTAARERIATAIQLTPPGTPQRWEKILSIVNRRTLPTEEEPDPLNIETNFAELKEITRKLYEEVKFISSDGLALSRSIIPQLFDKHSIERCRQVSQRERDERFLSDEGFAYGEVDSEIFATIFLKAVSVFGQQENGVFYDLGSGVGTLVFTAAFIGKFRRVVGIEYLSSLLSRGEKRMHRWNERKPTFPSLIQAVDFVWLLDDFVDNPSWTSDATFIFLHWTAFSWESRKMLTKFLRRCLEGTFVVTFTSPIPSKDFEVFLVDTCDTSWGKAEFFFHEKVTPPQSDDTFDDISPE